MHVYTHRNTQACHIYDIGTFARLGVAVKLIFSGNILTSVNTAFTHRKWPHNTTGAQHHHAALFY